MDKPQNDRHANTHDSIEVVFDGSIVTAITKEASKTITVIGWPVSDAHVGRQLAIRGGGNFIIGVYWIRSADMEANTWSLDRECSSGSAIGMIGATIMQVGRWHDPVPEYYDANLPDNAGE